VDTEALAIGDLDNNGKLDLVVGIASGTDKVWEGDGDGTFTEQASPGWGSVDTRSLALGDLNNDGDLDLVVGIASAADAVWTGDGDGTFTTVASPGWTGATSTRDLSLGDLNLDGDLDLIVGITGSTDTAWSGDGDGTFTQVTMPSWASTNTDDSVLGDFDNDGDLDMVSTYSSGIDEFFKNTGGSVGFTVTDMGPSELESSQTDDILKIEVTHNGITGDNDLEVGKWILLLEQANNDPLTTTEANNIIDNLYVYKDDGDGTWESGQDTLVLTLSSLSLSEGMQEITFDDGDLYCRIAATNSATYFVAVQLTSNAHSQSPNTFQVSFDPDADSLNEDRTEDGLLCVADSSGTTSTNLQAVPESGKLVVPVLVICALFVVARRRRRKRGNHL